MRVKFRSHETPARIGENYSLPHAQHLRASRNRCWGTDRRTASRVSRLISLDLQYASNPAFRDSFRAATPATAGSQPMPRGTPFALPERLQPPASTGSAVEQAVNEPGHRTRRQKCPVPSPGLKNQGCPVSVPGTGFTVRSMSRFGSVTEPLKLAPSIIS